MGDSGLEATVEDGWHRLDMVSWSRAHAFSVEADAKRQAKTVFATRDQRRGPDAPNELEGELLVDPAEDPTVRLIREILSTRQVASQEEADSILGTRRRRAVHGRGKGPAAPPGPDVRRP